MTRHALTIFVGAFLLFQVQPVLGKQITPWFGGGPAVWIACMLFFQTGLLCGYLYAHAIGRRSSPRVQAMVHLAAVGLALLFLPLAPDASWKPQGVDDPSFRILGLLAGSVGIPFMLLASTGPLIQRWLSLESAGRSPYRMYALSNAGSLLGLLTYPLIVEPLCGLQFQMKLWSVGFGCFALLVGWCAVRFAATPGIQIPDPADAAASTTDVGLADRGLWMALAACGSVLLLATTNEMAQYLPPTPFLWVLPLAIYLLSFVIAFDGPRWYRRRFWVTVYLVALPALISIPFWSWAVPLVVHVLVYAALLLAACMLCHGELYRLRPDPRHLTGFYLTVAVGGALGGLFTSLVAPQIFDRNLEFPLSLLLAFMLFGGASLRSIRERPTGRAVGRLGAGLSFVILVLFVAPLLGDRPHMVARSRNFYGTLSVVDRELDAPWHYRELISGGIIQGSQFVKAHTRQPLSYYHWDSGVGVAVRALRTVRRARDDSGLRIGAIGLGVGTITALTQPGDHLRFYEINEDVVRIARQYFTYLEDSRGTVETVVGDARISMERELVEDGPQRYDLLVLDAFNSDTIPIQLLTREALEIYRQHLNPDGVLALHITTDHLDLSPLALGLARQAGYEPIRLIDMQPDAAVESTSDWVLLTRNPLLIGLPFLRNQQEPWDPSSEGIVWTDDRSSLLRLLLGR